MAGRTIALDADRQAGIVHFNSQFNSHFNFHFNFVYKSLNYCMLSFFGNGVDRDQCRFRVVKVPLTAINVIFAFARRF